MKRIFLLLYTIPLFLLVTGQICSAAGFTGNIGRETFMINVSDFFPWMSTKAQNASGNGIENISDLIISIIPMLTTMMAVGAVLMVIWGGFHMVLGGVSVNQTEKGKGIMKDALIGLTLGLLAYVIITLLGSIFNI